MSQLDGYSWVTVGNSREESPSIAGYGAP
ncbi:uncharacterized protein METZ01_LOCUS118709 [marine metagenome]|uniref:Uncharacterized protein n=1 Tax=marine metagenome TaxID=408172 RepID=A0A381XM69_9ZZZZ